MLYRKNKKPHLIFTGGKKMSDNIGLILCTCGGTLEEKIDYDYLITNAKNLSQINIVKKVDFLCRDVDNLLDEMKNNGVNRILFACCSERSSLEFNEDIIEKHLNKAGFDIAMYEVANIREQCAWIHEHKDRTTKKAMDLIGMAYVKLKLNKPSYEFTDIKQEVLVIGGGVAGISAAQTLSKLGIKSAIVEQRPYLGGHAPQIPFLWQSEGAKSTCFSQCVVPVINRDLLLEDNVEIFTSSSVQWIEKKNGNFYAEISKAPQYVNPTLCVSCGKCADVCPVEIPNPYELSMQPKKAISKEWKLGVPDSYVIDDNACDRCGECVKICPTNAINLDAKEEIIKKEFGSVIFATGFDRKDMNEFSHLAYDKPNVITLLEFERLMANRFFGKPPMSVTFVMCQKDKVGYCSRLCCNVVAKHAYRMSKFFTGTETNVIFQDLRTAGRCGEYFKNESRDAGVEYIHANVEKIEGDDDWLTIYTDQDEIETQLVVLAEPLIPAPLKVAKMLGLQLDSFGFPMEWQPKVVRPLHSYVDRVFLAGAAKGFKDVQESIESGVTAAIRAHDALKGKKQKFISYTDLEKCSKCGLCVPICPHSAITISDKNTKKTLFVDPSNIEEKELKNIEIKINHQFCKGCGLCYTTCPSKAITLINLEDAQILQMADKAFEHHPEGEPRILAFLCYWCSYAGADLVGYNNIKTTENFRSIRIRCSASINPEVISEILFNKMADGVLVAGCPPENCHHLWGNYISHKRITLMQDTLAEFGIDRDRLRWEYIGVSQGDAVGKILNFMNKNLKKQN